MNWEQELGHVIVHAAHIGYGDPRAIFFGEIADYDPIAHVARATIPVFVTVDPVSGLTSDPAQTPWFPYMTLGIGCLWAPKVGDECMVIMVERATDAGIILGIAHSDMIMPPTSMLGGPLQQGEFAFVQRDSNSLFVLRKDGSITTIGQKGTNSVIGSDGSVVITGQNGCKYTMDANGDVTITAGPAGGTYQMLNSGSVIITGPEAGSGAGTVTIDATGSISLKPGSIGMIKMGL